MMDFVIAERISTVAFSKQKMKLGLIERKVIHCKMVKSLKNDTLSPGGKKRINQEITSIKQKKKKKKK